MKKVIAMGLFTVTMAALGVVADEGLKSGPQVGQRLPGAFHPLNVTGSEAGNKNCLVWQNGNNPVAMIFAREVSDSLASLVKKIDAETVKHKSANMGSFVVFLSDDEKLSDKLKTLAAKQKINSCIFAVDNLAGPKGYEVAKDAAVTVVLYSKQKVIVNHSYKKGELNAKAIETIVSEIPKILPPKK